jgi:hypothetical protein
MVPDRFGFVDVEREAAQADEHAGAGGDTGAVLPKGHVTRPGEVLALLSLRA